MAREAPILCLSSDEDLQLHKLVNAPSTPQAFAFRARIVLGSAATPGVPRNDQLAEQLGCHPDTVSKWRRRFQRHPGDVPRPGPAGGSVAKDGIAGQLALRRGA